MASKKSPQQRESILLEAERLTNQDRRETYGHPLDDYSRTAALFNALFAHKLKEPFAAEDLQLTMVLVKLSRQIHMPKRDNLTDAAGYLNCIDLTQNERIRRESER